MQKIISLYQRNYDGDHLVRDEVVPGAEWVLNGEGVPTRKWDGTCCMIRDGKLFKRYDAKAFTVNQATGEKQPWNRTPPEGFEPAQDADPVTGHWPGWVPVGDGPDDKWHREGWGNQPDSLRLDGTYELCGPKIGANPEGMEAHKLIPHGCPDLEETHTAPRDFEGLKKWFASHNVEGIVWHHPDGRMVKIKAKDFGIKRSAQVVTAVG